MSLDRTLISLKVMIKTIKREGLGILVELNQVKIPEAKQQSILDCLQHVLMKYKAVFNMPQGLSPSRGHQHLIVLKENNPLVCVQPYRYPYVHKIEIERLIKETLAACIIQVSNNPFSSPVLLVKMNVGLW